MTNSRAGSLDVMYLSLFSIADMALKFKVDVKYTYSRIESILFFARIDGLIDGHQYEYMVMLLGKDLEAFHSYMFGHVKFE